MEKYWTGKSPKNHKHRGLLLGVCSLVFLGVLLTGCFALGYHGVGAPGPTVPVKDEASKDAQTPPEKQQSPVESLQQPREEEKNEVQPAAEQPLEPGKKYSVLVDKSDHKLYLKDGDAVVRTWGCAVGKGGLGQKERRGDNMTPTGTFSVDEIDDASDWAHDFGDGNGEVQGAYGPWFLSLDTEALSGGSWDGIGIHGTHDPASIGTDASEGCVRLDNTNLQQLKQVAYIGMPVTIQD
ncbi:L,D-transpeptidase family protein [Acidaminococcus sp.]|uniref:L,D-transpeptidase n=1 Tax=Acidaminococcus sp. TaxID=1872103 RepID=UPI003D7D3E50